VNSFGTIEIHYLGHTIPGEGVNMDRAKVQKILEWYEPQNVKQLRALLGLIGYLSSFIRNYTAIAGPLTDLLKK